jgi:hypothetical protein
MLCEYLGILSRHLTGSLHSLPLCLCI